MNQAGLDQRMLVTLLPINTDDWKFNQKLLKNPELKEEIISKYIVHTKQKFAFYADPSKASVPGT